MDADPVTWFDSLSVSDFQNGAVRDEIREFLMDWVSLQATIAQLKADLEAAEAALGNAH